MRKFFITSNRLNALCTIEAGCKDWVLPVFNSLNCSCMCFLVKLCQSNQRLNIIGCSDDVLIPPLSPHSLCVKLMNQFTRWLKLTDSWQPEQICAIMLFRLLRSSSAAVPLLCSRTPCQVFQAHSQWRGSGELEACSLVKYLNYVIDVSTVINLAAAHPSSWPVPTQLHCALWRSCQTGPNEVCVCVSVFV